ncbi:MAG TPA: hydroxyisourate hydrolase [Pseudonocardiaceae bacterium]|jgi:5-hydroxyisourate hydrolase|nr:hydroxyisourate hydrolase [Pseudonocardiaceae bacterium]
MSRSAITTHVLDTSAGRPAEGVPVRLEYRAADGWRELGAGHTDADGRIGRIGPDRTTAGTHRLTFDTAAYFARDGREAFFPEVSVTFDVPDVEQHYHVPILLSPFAFSTYRGS